MPRERTAGWKIQRSGWTRWSRVSGEPVRCAAPSTRSSTSRWTGRAFRSLTSSGRRTSVRWVPRRRPGAALRCSVPSRSAPEGVSLGVSAREWWSRVPRTTPKRPNASRPTKEKETQRWLDAVTHTCEHFAAWAPETRCWFQLDREADSWPVLHHLAATPHWFTVRASRDRRLSLSTPGKPKYLRKKLAHAPVMGTLEVDIEPGHRRQARMAQLVIRAMTVRLELRDPWTKTCRPLSMQAVWVHERGTTPRGEKPLDWLLLTNHAVDTPEDALLVVRGYSLRWRIEDFHKPWKSGACNVEASQLRSTAHVT